MLCQALAVLSVLDLGSDNLSPFLAVTRTNTLKTDGIYQELRHPMYAGLLLTMFGLAVVTASPDRFLLAALLAYVMEVKTEKEEEFLMKQYPQEYAAYKVRTRTSRGQPLVH